MKKPVKVVLGAFLGVVLVAAGFFGYLEITTDLAERDARNFCEAVPMGASAQDVLSRAASAGAASDLTMNLQDTAVSVGWHGAFLDRWYCNLGLDGNRVVKKDVHFLD